MAIKYPYFDELISNISSEVLDTNCEENVLVKLADMFTGEESRSIARRMGVTINFNGSHTRVKDHKISLLTSTQFLRATYRELILKLYNLGRVDLIEAVLKQLKSQNTKEDVYTKHLKNVYHTYIPRRRHVWPPSKPCKYIKLSLKQVKDRQYDGAIQHLKEASSETETIELEDILSQDQSKSRKLFVVEGLSGIGKTTFVLNACKQWADGVLLAEYKYVIIVELQLIENAKSNCLSDILPTSHNQLFVKAFERKIQALLGKSTLFICDGWDELSPELQDPNGESVICNLLFHPERLSVQKSTVIITSRPDSTACLDEITTSHVQILGFTLAQTREYFTEVLHDSSQVEKLYSEMCKYPSLYGTCYIPLNAVILAHIFKILKGTLPHTLHDAYCKLVLICIIHEEFHNTATLDVLSFYDLSPELKWKLNQVAMLAYKGCRYCKAIFTDDDLQENCIPTLGLIQPVESFTLSGKAKTYSFVHLSIQQLLAAYYISQWPPIPQAEVFTQVFLLPEKINPFLTTMNEEINKLQQGHFTVIQHASGFTKLLFPQLRMCVLDVVQNYCAKRDSLLIGLRHTLATMMKKSFIMLMRCLYDAKNQPLSKEVASKLKGEINLIYTHVEPYDCLSIGYLAHHFTDEVEVIFFESAINGFRIELFCKEFLVAGQEKTYPKLKLCLQSSSVCDEGVKALVLLLQSEHMIHLNLEHNLVSSFGAYYIADTLQTNQSLTQLQLSHNSLSDEGASFIASALLKNTALLWLALNCCGITDDGFAKFSQVLQTNHTLQTLELSDNPFTDTGLMILSAGLETNRGLKTLRIDPNVDFDDSTPTGDHSSDDGTIVVKLVYTKSSLPKTVGIHSNTDSTAKLSSNITREGIELFVHGLSNHRCLTTLDIGIFYGKDYPSIQQAVKLVNKQRKQNGIQELSLTWDTATLGNYRMKADLSDIKDATNVLVKQMIKKMDKLDLNKL